MATNTKYEAAVLIDKNLKIMADIRAKLDHPFRVIKHQFGCVKEL